MPKLAYRATIPKPDDPSIVEPIAAAIALGEPMAAAAYAAGIAERTANEWVQRGLAAIDQAPPGTSLRELGPHARFTLAVKEAEARFVRENLSVVHRDKAVPGKGWLPAMTLLERRRPQDFGRRTFTEAKVETTSYRVSVDLTEAQRQALLSQLQEKLTAPPKLLPPGGDAQPPAPTP